MADALTSFKASNGAKGYGGVVYLCWTYPALLPTRWRLFIFKRKQTPVTDDEIAKYFNGQLNADQLSKQGIFVYNNLPAVRSFIGIKDTVVDNDTLYTYRAVIRDTQANTSSAILSDSATPATMLTMNTVDAKDIVCRGLEKTLQACRTIEGARPVVEKDIRIFKAHGERQQEDNFFVVSRTSGQIVGATLSDIIAQSSAETQRGTIDYDVFQIEWICMGVGERRDKYTNILRAMRPVLSHFIQLLGSGWIKSATCTMLGDADINYGGEGGPPALRGVMNVQIQTEQTLIVGADESLPWELTNTTFY